MLAAEWIREAKKAGWLVTGSTGLVLHLTCSKQGCTNSLAVPVNNLGDPPEPCKAPHAGHTAKHVFDKYQALVQALTRRRMAIGLSQEDLCAAAGLADGHINKLENFDRFARFETLQLWAETLGYEIMLNPTALPKATERAIAARAAAPYNPNQARFKSEKTKRLTCD